MAIIVEADIFKKALEAVKNFELYIGYSLFFGRQSWRSGFKPIPCSRAWLRHNLWKYFPFSTVWALPSNGHKNALHRAIFAPDTLFLISRKVKVEACPKKRLNCFFVHQLNTFIARYRNSSFFESAPSRIG